MTLDARERRLFARTILLAEIGEAGQDALLETRVTVDPAGDPGATAVARLYADRAGLGTRPGGTARAVALALPTTPEIDALAGRPELRAAAAMLAGSLACAGATIRALGIEAGRADGAAGARAIFHGATP
jgi:hypothetical protein